MGSGVFLKFFETLWKILVFLKKDYTDFQKTSTDGNSGQSPVCLHTPPVSLVEQNLEQIYALKLQ